VLVAYMGNWTVRAFAAYSIRGFDNINVQDMLSNKIIVTVLMFAVR
jgi:hypothetical protein